MSGEHILRATARQRLGAQRRGIGCPASISCARQRASAWARGAEA